MRISRLILITIALCSTAQASAQPLVVYAVNYPLAWVAERVGGAEVEVRFPVPPGEDPAFWDPSPDDIVAFRNADLILLNGAGYARWVAGASLPRRKLIDTSAAFADRLIEVDGDVVHSGSWLVGQKRKAAVHVTCACDHSCACMCVRLPNADTLL